MNAGSSLRLDKWLWFARVVKTRALAADLAEAGSVRINGVRATQAHKGVHVGDVLTIALPSRVRVLKVTALPGRRGSAEASAGLYEELTATRTPEAV